MDKDAALRELRAKIAADNSLPLRESNLVFGEGNPQADVMFIGEAPGARENELGRPFVGRAGQLLDKLIAEVGWRREDVYITNIVKRRPPENRDPLPEEIAAYQPYLAEQIRTIDPKIIVPLGRFSMNFFLPNAKISRDQGKVFRMKGKLIVPQFHPAAALRGTETMNQLRASFRKLPVIISRFDELTRVSAPSDTSEHAPLQESLL